MEPDISPARKLKNFCILFTSRFVCRNIDYFLEDGSTPIIADFVQIILPTGAPTANIWSMSEYIEIEAEMSEDPAVLYFYTNLTLAEEEAEEYDSAEAMEEGSPVAQALAYVEGIHRLRLDGQEMTVTRDLGTPQHIIVAEISAALKDFFL